MYKKFIFIDERRRNEFKSFANAYNVQMGTRREFTKFSFRVDTKDLPLGEVVPFQQLLERPMDVLLCERVNDLRHSLFHLLNCLITTASELRE